MREELAREVCEDAHDLGNRITAAREALSLGLERFDDCRDQAFTNLTAFAEGIGQAMEEGALEIDFLGGAAGVASQMVAYAELIRQQADQLGDVAGELQTLVSSR